MAARGLSCPSGSINHPPAGAAGEEPVHAQSKSASRAWPGPGRAARSIPRTERAAAPSKRRAGAVGPSAARPRLPPPAMAGWGGHLYFPTSRHRGLPAPRQTAAAARRSAPLPLPLFPRPSGPLCPRMAGDGSAPHSPPAAPPPCRPRATAEEGGGGRAARPPSPARGAGADGSCSPLPQRRAAASTAAPPVAGDTARGTVASGLVRGGGPGVW